MHALLTHARVRARDPHASPGSRARRAAWWSRRALPPCAALALLWVLCALPDRSLAARPGAPRVHALRGATVVTAPGATVPDGVIVIRDGRIAAVGPAARVAIPADARVWDCTGQTIYAGFIEPCIDRAEDEEKGADKKPLTDGNDADPGVAGPSAAYARVRPERRAVDGLAPADDLRRELRRLGFTAACFAPASGVIRGTAALIGLGEAPPNEAVISADAAMAAGIEERGFGSRTYPSSTMGSIACLRQAVYDARFYRDDQADFARRPTGRTRPAYDPSLAALQPVIERKLPLLLATTGVLSEARAVAIADELGVEVALLSTGEEWRRPDLFATVRVPLILPVAFPDVPRLDDDADWAQISLDELRAWDWAAENPAVVARLGVPFAFTSHGLKTRSDFWSKLRAARERGLTADQALGALTLAPARIFHLDDRLGTIEAGKIANLTVVRGGLLDDDARVDAVWVDGACYPTPPRPAAEHGKEHGGEDAAPSAGAAGAAKADSAAAKPATLARVAREPFADRGALQAPPVLVVRNATLWTCGAQGTLTAADLLVRGGKIVALGRGLSAPADALVIDATGKQVTPGLIDCHSHMAIVGEVNEGTHSCTSEVRIGDVVNSETRNIYLELAGGLTSASLLHGSANAIGGQNQVIKLRWGAGPEALKFEGAPLGIKFALGENPKRSNAPPDAQNRYPGTRMGVEQVIRERFAAAADYQRAWDSFKGAAKGKGVAPRRDLQLEAIAEILAGSRRIHCHSYRQDEILMLIRLMEQFHVKIGTFQHVLEGYKVADEIAAHGAGASSFSDWWAYKFEVYDAIPYSGTIMNQRGVVVSFNSDSPDLARRLNWEASKAVKYGGTSEEDALKFVTLNPAKQLGIDARVGSLEVGKDADFVIWSGHPLATSTMCQQTWIDGKEYFDREADAQVRARAQAEYDALVAKAKEVGKKSKGGSEGTGRGGSPSAEEHFDDRAGIWTRGGPAQPYAVPQELLWDGTNRGCLGSAESGEEHALRTGVGGVEGADSRDAADQRGGR